MRLAGFALCVLTLAPLPAIAQAPDDRAQIERLRAELSAIPDSATLKAREASGIERAKLDRDNALLHLELGFVAYRLGEVTGEKQHFDDAGSEFEWAGELKPDWPFPWYGLGLAELAHGELGNMAIENIRQFLGKDYLSKAADAFVHAAQVDPTFVAALVDLGETALRQRINARLDVALMALRTASRTGVNAPAVLLQLGRLEREAGSDDSSVQVFHRYMAAGGDSAIGLFESARALSDLQRTAPAESAYFSGARLARSRESRALYRRDAAWAASPEEVSALDSLAAANRLADGLERLWRSRDVEGALRRGQGLAEHQRRFLYAWRHFRLVSRHRHYDVTETFRSDQSEFDDRGVIYLRQGEPVRRAIYSAPGVEPNESWLYERPDGNVVLHFVARDDVDDYKLVRSITDLFGFDTSVIAQTGLSAPSTFRARQPAGAAADPVVQAIRAAFSSRSSLDPIYQQLASGGAGAVGLMAEERRRGIAAIHLGTTTTDYAPRFAHPINPIVETYALADSARTGARLLLVFGLPARELEARALPQGQAYPVEVRVSGENDQGAVIYADTTRVFVAPHVLRGSEHLSWALSVPAPAGHYTLHIVVAQPGTEAGAVLRVDTVMVPPFGLTAAGLLVSDLVAGRAGSGLVSVMGRDTIALNPIGTYPVDGAVDLYYEVGGLTRGEHYHTRITVDQDGSRSIFRRIFGGGGPAVNLEFDAVGDSTVVAQRQRVRLSGLDAGRYRLTLDVSGPTGEAHHIRRATLTIQKP